MVPHTPQNKTRPTITPFHVPHDAAETLGFRFELGGTAIGYATDIGQVTAEAERYLRDTSILALETNHDVRVLQQFDQYSPSLKSRISSSHLSNKQATQALKRLATNRTKAVVGMHISEKTNTPSLALAALNAARKSIKGGSFVMNTIIATQANPISVRI